MKAMFARGVSSSIKEAVENSVRAESLNSRRSNLSELPQIIKKTMPRKKGDKFKEKLDSSPEQHAHNQK
jgi:hypothetical protein